MADDRNSQTVYASLQAEIDRLSKRNEDIYVKLDSLNGQLATIPFAKMDKKRQVKNQINSLQRELKDNERRINQKLEDQKRLQIVDERTDARETAYQNGIDPNAAWANATASGLGSVASVVGTLGASGLLKPKQNKGEDPKLPPSVETPSKTPIYLGIAAVILVILMMKKK